MSNINTISVDGEEISISGRVEFGGGILSIPNNPSSRRLLKRLTPTVEGQTDPHSLMFQGKKLPENIVILTRAPLKQVSEG